MGCKVFFFSNLFFHSLGFTLTMWDVKFLDILSTTAHATFYLNYVGCKALLYAPALPINISFTLTMWDVKRIKLFLFFSCSEVLP